MHIQHKLNIKDKLHLQNAILESATPTERLIHTYTNISVIHLVTIRSINTYIKATLDGRQDFSTVIGDNHRTQDKTLKDILDKIWNAMNKVEDWALNQYQSNPEVDTMDTH